MEDFTKAKDMCMPRNVIVGHGVLPKVAEVCENLVSGKDILMITGNDTYKVAGKEVESILRDEHYNISIFKAGNANIDTVEEASSAAKEFGAEAIVAVGGGSKIDIGKMAAKNAGIPLISIPTSASHDGIASGRASLKSEGGSTSVDAVVPLAIIADTGVILRSPYRLLASGCADVISNTSAVLDWEFARRLKGEEFSTYAYTLSVYSAESIINNASLIRPNLEESVWIAVKPMIVSGISMSVAGSSRPTSGSEHMFSHALDMIAPGKALHGEQCGVGSIMMTYLHGGDWKRIRSALKQIGAPVNAEGLGVSPKDITDALTMAHKVRSDRFTILGDRGLTKDAAEDLAKNTKVI